MKYLRFLAFRLRGFRSKVRGLLFRGEAERDLTEEIRFHVEQRTLENLRAGMGPREARRKALVAFGGVERWKVRAREARGILPVDNLIQDVRLALRRLRKRPLFTFTSVLTLAFGLGAGTSVFSVAYAVLFRPFPFQEPDDLVQVWDASGEWGLSEPEFLGLQERTRTLRDIAAYLPSEMNLQGPQGPARIRVPLVTPNLFSVLGVSPALGTLLPADANLGGNQSRLVVISHGLWQQEFGGDPAVIGRGISLDEAQYRVIGVMPRQFDFPVDGDVAAWVPLPLDPVNPVGSARYLNAVARKRRSIDEDAVAQELNQLNLILTDEILSSFPGGANVTDHFSVIPLRDETIGGFRNQLVVLLGSVGLVLMMVCANLSMLLLGEGQRRQQDVAMQLAVGAPRGFVIRGLLVESLVLSLGGCIAGIGLTVWTTGVLSRSASGIVPLIRTAEVNLPVLVFSVGLAVTVSLLISLMPALRTSSLDLASWIKGSNGGVGVSIKDNRLRGSLVTAQLALSVLIVVGAGMVVGSYQRLREVELGFNAESVLTVALTPPESRYGDHNSLSAFYDAIEERVSALPGVLEVGVTTLVPLDGSGGNTVFGIEGSGAPWDGSTLAYFQIVSEGFFRAIGATILEGRDFEGIDNEDASGVVILNRTAARMYWPHGSAVGRRLQLWPSEPWLTVIGVVNDVRSASLERAILPRMYLPRRQSTYLSRLGLGAEMDLVMRTAVDPTILVPQLRASVWEVDPQVPLSSIRTLDQVVSATTAAWRVLGSLVGLFALVAILLAGIGVYGVTACNVGARTSEFAVRLALGATRQSVVRLAMVGSARSVLPGIGIGVGGALVLGLLLSRVLYGVAPMDGRILVSTVALLTGLALFASYLPARIGTRVEPMRVLERR